MRNNIVNNNNAKKCDENTKDVVIGSPAEITATDFVFRHHLFTKVKVGHFEGTTINKSRTNSKKYHYSN